MKNASPLSTTTTTSSSTTSSSYIQQQKQIPSTISNLNENYYCYKQQQPLSKSLLELSNKGYVNEKDICKYFNQQQEKQQQQYNLKQKLVNNNPNPNQQSTSYSMRDLAAIGNQIQLNRVPVKSAFVKPSESDYNKYYKSLINKSNSNCSNSSHGSGSSSCRPKYGGSVYVDDIDVMIDYGGGAVYENAKRLMDEPQEQEMQIKIETEYEDDDCNDGNVDLSRIEGDDDVEERSTHSLNAKKMPTKYESMKKKSFSIEHMNEMQPPPHIQPLSGVLSKSLMSVVLKPHPVKPVADISVRKLNTLPAHFQTQTAQPVNVMKQQKYASTNNINLPTAATTHNTSPPNFNSLKPIKEKFEAVFESKKDKKGLFKKNSQYQNVSKVLSKPTVTPTSDQLPKRSRFLELKNFFSSSSSSKQQQQVQQAQKAKTNEFLSNDRKLSTTTTLYEQMNAMKNELTKYKTQLNYELLNSKQLKVQINELNLQLSKKQIQNATTQTANYDSYNTQKLSDELNNLRQQLDYERKKFENEKEKWLCEKDKVIKFQKYLQINYAQCLNQNKILKNQIEILTTTNGTSASSSVGITTTKNQFNENLVKQCHQFI